jgi:hypothetical protein
MPRPAGKPVANDTPVRVGPVVQRTWIKRHADSNDMFIGDVLVYKEIVPTHWAGFRRPVGLGVAAPGGSAGVYPHRPSSGPPPAKTSAATPDAPNSGASVERNPFAQPGNASPGPGEMAPAPASPSGANTSLPQ